MGGFLSRRLFPRAKDLSTYGLLLEGLEAEISELSSRRASKFAQHRQLVRSLVLYSSASFVCLCGVMYVLAAQYSRPVVITPIVVFPVVVVLVKRAFDAMFDRSVRHDDRILARLEAQKERMLEELIESTKFTQTRQLIDKFAKKAPGSAMTAQQQHMARQQQQMRQQQQLQAAASSNNTPRKPTPAGSQSTPSSSVSPAVSTRTSSFTPPQPTLPGLLPGQPYVTPADIQRFHRTDVQRPAHRSAVDKVIDFALGDGPNNRYALICASCFTHNGLVKEDDLDSVRYRCVMCNYINGKKLPADWKPTIHSNTIESIIQSTPTKLTTTTRQQPLPQSQQEEDDTDSSLLFPTRPRASSTAVSLRLPDSTQLSTSTSSPSIADTASNTLPARDVSRAEEQKEVAQASGERDCSKEGQAKIDKSEHKEEGPAVSADE